MKKILFSLLILFLASCVNTKVWLPNQYLLAPPIVKGNKILPAETFLYMHRQKPNISQLKVAMYQRGARRYDEQKIKSKIEETTQLWDAKRIAAEKRGDSLRESKYIAKKEKKLKKLNRVLEKGNWLMRVVGDEPVFFDSMATVHTALEMNKLLKEKGFFQGQVDFQIDTLKRKRKRAIYTITENLPTYLDSIAYKTDSPAIDSLIKKHETEKILKKGDYYNTANIDAERMRIEHLLLNNGYMHFTRQYISIEVDTLHFLTYRSFDHTNYTDAQQDSLRKLKRNAKIAVIIDDPILGEHKPYHIEAIYVHQTVPKNRHFQPDTIISRKSGINYIYIGKTLYFEHRVLDKRIRLKRNELFSQQKLLESQNSMNLLDMYKYVNTKIDTLGGKLHVHLFSAALDRYQHTFEGGANLAQGLPGPFVNFSLKNRNIFGEAEFLETTLRFMLDGQASTTGQGSYSSTEVGGTVALSFPRILFPSPLLPKGLRENIYAYNPTTKLTIGYGFTRRPEYTRSNLAGSIAYKGQLKRATYNLTLAEISFINTIRISPAFSDILDSLDRQGNPIRLTFGQALVGSTYFTYTFSNATDAKMRKSYYFRILLEVGGNTLRLLDRNFGVRDNNLILNVPYFQFYRVNPTFHYYIPLTRERSWAFRVNGGIAIPYGKSNVLPYEKYFFAGGSSSVRAWLPRFLGQGAVPLEIDGEGRPNYRSVEKPGEIILEANAEYRFPLYQGWIKGATFIDAGNVWRIREDATTLGGGFRFSEFYKQLAIGAGFGIRMDFQIILLRLDTAIKVHEPRQVAGKRWVLWDFAPSEYLQQRLLNFNIAIGYPF